MMAASLVIAPACTDDLDQYPHTETTSEDLYQTIDQYESVLAKLYASFSIAGQEKGGSDADLSSNMGQDLMRCLFNLQEAATDEVINTWLPGDQLEDLTYYSWDANDPWVNDVYYRLYYNIALCNEFLRYCTDDQISGFSSSEQETLTAYRAEARYLRALNYYYVLDLFKKGPMVTEENSVGAYVPDVADADGLFNYIESELKECSEEMTSRTETVYGRAPRAAAWMLLSRLYLNSEVYVDVDHYTDCITYSQKVIDEGYTLNSDYAALFNADNNNRTNEIIYHIEVDATNTVSWGTTTNLVCGAISNDKATAGYSAENYGAVSGWGSMRSRSPLPSRFEDGDVRAMFFSDEQSLEVSDYSDQSQGYLVTKWTNLTDAGEAASNTSNDGVCTDYPFYRLAEAYLNLAEAVARGGAGSSTADAATYISLLRTRAGVSEWDASDITTDNIFEERSRELYWETLRRTDLIRYGYFTSSSYTWDLKPSSIADKYNYYPIPQNELTANPNLSNPEY